MDHTAKVNHHNYVRFIFKRYYSSEFKAKCEGWVNMEKKLNSLKYFAPIVQLALCPVSILILWTVFTVPEVIPVVNEEFVI